MKSVGKRRPADFINADLPPERVARMWRVIEARQRAGTPRHAWGGRPWVLAGAVAFAACLLVWVASTRYSSSTQKLASTGDVIVTEQRGTALGLPDGSSVLLGEAARLSVSKASVSEVELHLDRGRVACDVVHDPARRFVVEAAGVEVHVKGTRFTVEVDASQISVHVERGAVEVTNRSGALLATMTPGQSWSGPVERPLQAPPAAAPSAAPFVEPALEPSAALPAPAAPAALDGNALFERANSARIAGRPGPAAADYDRFRTRFPQDPRAGLAAFELGRIRLDSLGDPARALVALRFALGHARGGFAVEDAQALQVDALARLGDTSGCRKARAAFLKAHPSSAHAARVSRACPDE